MKNPRFAAMIVGAMHYFDQERYDLNAYVVMPNHIHVIVRPLQSRTYSLEAILKSWKQFSSRRINGETHGVGALWQEESYDRIVRDEEHLYRCLQYIGRNPLKANLAMEACPSWIKPEWVERGWTFLAQ